MFAVVGGGLRWQKNDGGYCSGDCSSSSLCRGSSLCFSLSLSVLIAFSPITVFVLFPSSLCLLFFWYVLLLFLFSLSLSLSPLFSPVFLYFFFGFSLLSLLFSLISFFFLFFSVSLFWLFLLFSFNLLRSLFLFLCFCSLFFFSFSLMYLNQFFLQSLILPPSFSVFSLISPFWFFRFFPPISPQNSPRFALFPLLFIRVKKEREGYYHRGRVASGHWAATPEPPAGLVSSAFLSWQFKGCMSCWFFESWEREGSGKYRGTNLFFPCLYASRGRRSSTVPFKTTPCHVPFFFFLGWKR